MLLGSRGKWVLLRARGFIHFIYLLKIKVHWWSRFDSYEVYSSFDVHLKENLSSLYLTQTVRRTGADYPGLTGSRRRRTSSYCIIQIFCFALTFFPFFDGKIPFSVSVVAHTTFCSSVPPVGHLVNRRRRCPRRAQPSWEPRQRGRSSTVTVVCSWTPIVSRTLSPPKVPKTTLIHAYVRTHMWEGRAALRSHKILLIQLYNVP